MHAKTIYDKLNMKIEKMCDFLYLTLVYGSIVGLLPALLTTLVNYFVYELSKDSYILPVPFMYSYLNIYKRIKIRNFEKINRYLL